MIVGKHVARPWVQRGVVTCIKNNNNKSTAGSAATVVQQQRRHMGMWPKVKPVRVRVITCDVTGTLVSFRGSLDEHYLGSARKCGVELAPDVPIAKAFNRAYSEVCRLHPCFGGSIISGKDWWKLCVSKSFEYAGVDNMTEDQKERVFQRIFSAFGSLRAYEKFSDTLPFLHFAVRNDIVCGTLSNADERYRDSILPMLGVTDDELHFQCFSKDYSIEKPDPRFFAAAMKAAELNLKDPSDPLLPSHCLHIGNGTWPSIFFDFLVRLPCLAVLFSPSLVSLLSHLKCTPFYPKKTIIKTLKEPDELDGMPFC